MRDRYASAAMSVLPSHLDCIVFSAFFEGKAANVVVHYELSADESASSRGIVELDSATGRVTRFFEKPSAGMTTSRNASVVLYCFQPSAKAHFRTYLDASAAAEQHPFGLFLAHLLSQDVPLYGMKLPTKFKLIGTRQLRGPLLNDLFFTCVFNVIHCRKRGAEGV